MTKKFLNLVGIIFLCASAGSAQFMCEYNLAYLSLQTEDWASEIDLEIYNQDSVLMFSLSDELQGNPLANNSFYTFQVCLPDGCYSVSMIDGFGDGWNGANLTLGYGIETIALGTLDYGASEWTVFGINTENCEAAFPGCMDPMALNFNAVANTEDGSCIYPIVCEEGITAEIHVSTGENGEEFAVEIIDEYGNSVLSLSQLDDWAYSYFPICIDSTACYTVIMSNNGGNNGWNGGYLWITSPLGYLTLDFLDYNLSSETITFSFDQSCPYSGCTDPMALNFDPLANVDDGSCLFPEACEDNTLIVTVATAYWSAEISWSLLNENGEMVWSGGEYYNNYWQYSDFTCLADGCYTLVMYDSFGDGWNGGIITLAANGETLYIGGVEHGSIGTVSFTLNAEECNPILLFGCTDPVAFNYNPEATLNDGSCIPVMFGCTDPDASNYYAWANTDDGSCIYPEPCEGISATLYICTFSNGSEIGLQILDDEGNELINVNNLGNVQIEYIDLCLPATSDCYTVNMYNSAGNTGWYNGYFWINYDGLQLINESLDIELGQETAYFSLNGGCPVSGCTDPEALNYEPNANEDDGSCTYPQPCEDHTILYTLFTGNFPSEITWSFINEYGLEVASGNGNGLALNQYATFAYCLPDGCYSLLLADSFGDGWNGAVYSISLNGEIIAQGGLQYGSIQTDLVSVNAECGNEESYFGCTNPEALNFDPNATVDDGSCQYFNELCNYNPLLLLLNTQTWGYEISWELRDSGGVVIASGDNYSSWSGYAIELCLPDGCYEFHMFDSWGDGWNGGYYMILGEDQLVAEGTLLYGDYTMDLISINGNCAIAGCMNAEALNFNPNATMDDGSCIYNGGFGEVFDEFVSPELDVDFDFFPNPFEFDIQVVFNNLQPDKEVILELFDELGRNVYALNYGSNQTHFRRTLDLNELESGMYLIRISNGDKAITKRIIKQ
jgi:hypothetical protein